MKKELTQKLLQKYNSFFEEMILEPTETPHTPVYLFGIECDDGWYNLLDSLFIELTENVKDKAIQDSYNHPERTEIYEDYPQISQIKEKFGGLCFYVRGATTAQYDIIHKYESKSYHTCETCGKPGKMRNHYNWYLTACKPCFKEILTRPYKRSTYWDWYWWNTKRTLQVKQAQWKFKFINFIKQHTNEIFKKLSSLYGNLAKR